MLRKTLLGALVVASCVVMPSAASAAPSLTGEQLYGVSTISNYSSSSCPLVSDGAASYGFTISGTAAGPYPGTFTESGSVTVDGYSGLGFLSTYSFHATFTINSPAGDVQGTKSGSGTPSQNAFLACGTETNSGRVDVSSLWTGPVPYTATISSPTGTTNVHGDSTVESYTVRPSGGTGTPDGSFYETYDTSAPDLPTTATDCTNDGYKAYGLFKNQGDCVSFIATKGKNAPAGT
jgi:hypothetical protein